MERLRILHLTNFVGKRSFGIGPIVLGLASSQQALGHNVSIYSVDAESEARELETAYHLRAGTIQNFPILGPSRLAYSPQMEHYVLAHAADYDVVHTHGIWTYISRVANRWRVRQGGPTIVVPHGSLDAWVLKRSRWKKRMALWLYERENLHRASCLHALSQHEAEGFRAYGLRNPIAIIPNGVSENWLASTGDAFRFRSKFYLAAETRLMFFLSRITPKKGLPMLLHAMADLRQHLNNWKLVIAGVNEFGHQSELEALIDQLGLQSHVRFIGPLYGQDKRDAFDAAELFVLPSHSEGAPVVILEALGAGVPVLTTKASPWEELVTHQCGWWTEISQGAIADALRNALQQSPATLREMGARGQALVRKNYTWPSIARVSIELYEWLLGCTDRPSFVIV